MQSINPPSTTQLLQAGQQPLLKVEIYVGSWINLCNLNGKNYVEGVSVSLGGSSMTPNPVGGTLTVAMANENSYFHPNHPTSPYKTYLKTGRKVRISIGAKYGETEYYWTRVIGYIDEPRFGEFKIDISGADYMKFLEDTEFKREIVSGKPDNYWGDSALFSSWPSDGKIGSEKYNEIDAMDINNENDNVVDWTPTSCSVASYGDTGGGSTYVARVTNTILDHAQIRNTNVCTLTAGKRYHVKFKYRRVSGSGVPMIAGCFQMDGETEVDIGSYPGLASSIWTEIGGETKYEIMAVVTGPLIMQFEFGDENQEFRIDQISIWEFKPYDELYYTLPGTCKGVFYVTLNGDPVWEGESDECWKYYPDTLRLAFNVNKVVEAGTDNLIVYYFTQATLEEVLADLLVKIKLYANRAAALSDMDYTPTSVTLDRIWFASGSALLNAVKKICERCDYRFYFRYDGKPIFKPKPTPDGTDFSFTAQKHIASAAYYQDRNEIKNRIVIEGEKQETEGKDEAVPPELKGEASNTTSINAYGERTLTIKNHLFQDQTSIDDMCTSLLAEYKDPKWYTDLEVPFNPVPLELGDKIAWKERLNPALELSQTGMLRDIKISDFSAIYKCEVV